MELLLSGNEAIARGAYEAGVEIAAAYPGTPSTEILENISKFKEIYAEWSVNEKVAFEVALGGSLGGKRVLAAMKHVGVNVAADSLMTASYVGVNGGLVVVSADDPGMHSSQNEQDNRYFARMAKIPMLEPSDSQETKDFTILAYQLSERFDTPVLLRMTTRICHGKGKVKIGKRITASEKRYEKNPLKYLMVPSYARERHKLIEKRREQLETFSETFDGNKVENRDSAVGIISSGVAYQYAKEVFPEASFFKLGMIYPLPGKALLSFAKKFEKLYIIEELEPYIEEQLRALGIELIGKDILPRTGEYSPELLRKLLLKESRKPQRQISLELPNRPPVLCPGCPYRGVFYILKKLKAVVTGDIGCYTLSGLPPIDAMDTCVCMGASIGLAQGLKRTLNNTPEDRIVAVLGDSTFIHAGIPGLVNAVYNGYNITVVILDNRTTAMTGHQENPGTGRTLQGSEVKAFDFEGIVKASGVGFVKTIDPIDLKETEKAIKDALSYLGPSVIIAKRACVLIERNQFDGAQKVDAELCNQCDLCLKLGCPAVSVGAESVVIDPTMCEGCKLCAQICPKDAISTIKN